jgi:hypothetical protein
MTDPGTELLRVRQKKTQAYTAGVSNMFDLSGAKDPEEKVLSITKNESVEEALDRSTHELQLLANFYHQHSYPERAQEIYRTILKIRRDQDKKRA